MLALNVSAEIFNAFKLVDKGLKKSNTVLDAGNANIPAQITKLAKKKPELQQYADRAPQARALSKEFNEYITGIWQELVDGSGGRYPDDDPKFAHDLKGKKDKDTPTRILVNGPDAKGEAIKAKVLEYRQKFLELIDEADRDGFTSKISMEIDDESWQTKKAKNWSEYNFRQMPVGALEPMFTKFVNDAKSTESAILNYYLEKVGGEDIVLDKFQVVSSPKKTYVIKGDKFETDVFLSASASASSNTGVSITVNGSRLSVKDGVAKFTETANSTGVKKYTAKISVTNPVTNETNSYNGSFEYEVGLRSVNVSADKMNVFYIGVDNPISVSAAGVNSNELKVSLSGGGGQLKKTGSNSWNVTVTRPEPCKINVNAGPLKDNKEFRVKRIPDPIARLGKKQDGAMGNGEFKAQQGLIAWLDNFDFDAKCRIQGFTVVRVPKREDPIESINPSGTYNAKSKRIVNAAKPGDTYYFRDVKARCPGDTAGRKINSMVFNIR